MFAKIHLIILALLFLVISSCVHERNPFIISDVFLIQKFEEADHVTCNNLHKSMDRRIKTENSSLYWRCRLALAKEKLLPNTSSSADLEYNLKVSDLIRAIYFKLKETPEEISLESSKKIDDRQHKKCLKMGFELNTTDQIKVDNYFSCRKILIEEEQSLPPFGNQSYKPYMNRSYNLSFVINRQIDKENKIRKEEEKKYGACMKFSIHSVDFKNCKAAQDNSMQCYKDLSAKMANKELTERLNCQRRAYIEFPDRMMVEKDRRSWEVEEENARFDYQNKNNFLAIGIDDLSQFGAIQIEKEKQKAERKNSKDGLYTKVELAFLRRKYVISCNKDADKKVFDYLDKMNVDCEKLKEFKLEGEN